MQDSPPNVLASFNIAVGHIAFLTAFACLNSVWSMEETIGLSTLTRQVLQCVFAPEQSQAMATLLVEECSPVKVHSPTFDEAAIERIWLAILKVSDGDTDRFLSAITLAQTDWRDLLMNADFGHDTSAHFKWAGHILD